MESMSKHVGEVATRDVTRSGSKAAYAWVVNAPLARDKLRQLRLGIWARLRKVDLFITVGQRCYR